MKQYAYINKSVGKKNFKYNLLSGPKGNKQVKTKNLKLENAEKYGCDDKKVVRPFS